MLRVGIVETLSSNYFDQLYFSIVLPGPAVVTIGLFLNADLFYLEPALCTVSRHISFLPAAAIRAQLNPSPVLSLIFVQDRAIFCGSCAEWKDLRALIWKRPSMACCEHQAAVYIACSPTFMACSALVALKHLPPHAYQ